MKKKKPADSKAWASFRCRGIKSSLEILTLNTELSTLIINHLKDALKLMDKVVMQLDKERLINELIRSKK